VTKRKYPYEKTAEFFSQEENFGVLIFGSSHMYTSVYPLQLWNDYGIISYNLGQTSSTIAISYYNLLLACKENKPKLVVLDTYLITEDYKIYSKNLTNSMHNTFDPYSFSYIKYMAIMELFDEKNILDIFFEYLFNFSLYHSRWNELEKSDFVK